MPNRQVARDATANRVASAVQRHRKRLGLTLGGLSERLTELGRPIGLGQLSKLEGGDRRVDVDDLVALAVALGVSPLALLLPPEADDSQVSLTPAVRTRSRDAWRWGAGDAVLPPEVVGGPGHLDLNALGDLQLSSPHRTRSTLTLPDIAAHRDVLVPLAEAAATARAAGLSHADVRDYLDMSEATASLTASVFRPRRVAE